MCVYVETSVWVCVCVCVCVCVYVCLCVRSEEHTSELQSHLNLVCRLLRGKIYVRVCEYTCGALDCALSFFFFFNDTAPAEIYTLSLHDALPILCVCVCVCVYVCLCV